MEALLMAMIMNLKLPSSEPTFDTPGTDLKIRKGMTKRQVVAVFGAPSGQGTLHNGTTFIYRNKDICEIRPGASIACDIWFDDNGKIKSVSEVRPALVSPELYD